MEWVSLAAFLGDSAATPENPGWSVLAPLLSTSPAAIGMGIVIKYLWAKLESKDAQLAQKDKDQAQKDKDHAEAIEAVNQKHTELLQSLLKKNG